jgi:hypothetical protein
VDLDDGANSFLLVSFCCDRLLRLAKLMALNDMAIFQVCIIIVVVEVGVGEHEQKNQIFISYKHAR